MANPDVAMAFQNPRVQQAIMDVSTDHSYLELSSVTHINMIISSAVFSKPDGYCQISKWQGGNLLSVSPFLSGRYFVTCSSLSHTQPSLNLFDKNPSPLRAQGEITVKSLIFSARF